MKHTINIIGLGYIGLPTALMFAAHGVKVIGTDYNKQVVTDLTKGELTFEENGLCELFEKALRKNIRFTTEYISTDIYIVAVPTPYEKRSKKIDSSYIIAAINNVLDVCVKGAIICIESTISPGTFDKIIRPIIQNKGFIIGKDIHLVHTPERIIPGNMIYELENNSRTIGCDDVKIGEVIKNLYGCFCNGDMVITDIRSAEMSKVVENSFRDVNIAFANELAKICSHDSMDVYEIIKIANMHPRVNILQPGPGVGGHCISVDPWFLVGDYPDITNIIRESRKINDSMPLFVIERISNIMKEHNIKDVSKVGLYGLTYKENIDDTRESPSIQLINKMQSNLAYGIKSYDPYIKEKIVDGQYYDFDKFIEDIDIIVIVVSHNHIKRNMSKIKNKIIFDTRNICSYEGIYKL